MNTIPISMAAELNARHNKHPTIAFTLPISCQVCLGKVKNPVLCPNNHAFCATCMDVWLQKNKHCPACRVAMTSTKKIMGGLSQHDDRDSEKMTNPDLRKARFDLLYKEYENEFESMQSEIALLKTENQILKQQARREGGDSRSGSGEPSRQTDTNGLLVLTKKLQDATKLYEKVKGELTRLKQENMNLKDENVSLNRESNHVRQELAGRSPARYGRTTVSTLESKLASAEKDVTRLTKALERSDKYIEELEKEREDYKGRPSSSSSKGHNSASDMGDKYLTNGESGSRQIASDSKVSSYGSYSHGTDNPSKRQLFSDDKGAKSSSGERSKYYYDRVDDSREHDRKDVYSQSAKSNGKNGGKKAVTFDLEKNTTSTSSFNLEMPSPLKTSGNGSMLSNGRNSPVKGVLKKAAGKSGTNDKSLDNYSTDMSKTMEDSLSSSYNSKPLDKYSKDDDLVYMKSRSSTSSGRNYDDDLYSGSKKKNSADDSMLDEPSENLGYGSKKSNDYDSRSRDYDRRFGDLDLRKSDLDPVSSRGRGDDELDRVDLDDTQHIESELDELNISLTPEFTDCMKLLNRAEKKVHDTNRDVESDDDLTSRYKSSKDMDLDSALRASTGSIGFKSGSSTDNFLPSYKQDVNSNTNNRFTSSLDSYSRGKHVRSGSLDNLYIDPRSEESSRPSSALPTSSNMYPSTSQGRYSSGLTTGRTTLTRTPSLDNLIPSKQGYQSKYSSSEDPLGFKSRVNLPSYPSYRPFGENKEKVDVNHNAVIGGVGSGGGIQPITAQHDLLGYKSTSDEPRVSFDSVLQARARSLADMGSTGSGGTKMDLDFKASGSDRLAPNLQGISTGTGDFDKMHTASGRVTPTIPSHSEYMAMQQKSSSTDKYSYTAPSNSSRLTPTLSSTNTNTDFNTLTKPNSQYPDYKSSGPSSLSDLSMKPPSGSSLGPGGVSRMQPISAPYSSSSVPTYHASSSAYTNSGDGGYSSMPTYTSSGGSSGGGYSSLQSYTTGGSSGGAGYDVPNKYDRSAAPSSSSAEGSKYTGSSYDYKSDNFDIGSGGLTNGRQGYNHPDSENSKFSSSSNNVPSSLSYADQNFKDGTHFSNFSSKISASDFPLPVSALSNPSSANIHVSSSSFAGSAGMGIGSSSSYSNTAYLPTTLTSSLSATSSYSTAHSSVPLTHTTSSYTSSLPSNTYTSKPLDPITESGHYSYVSNVSGDYSKNDTFALPEPKKRLFENSDDFDMSMSPIKTNRRF